MTGPPPPFGHPWLADVGRNPNINRDPPPPPVDGVVPGAAPPGHILVNGPSAQPQVVMQAAPAANAVLVDAGMPPVGIGFAPPGMGYGLDPYGPGYGLGMGLGMGVGMGMGMGYNSGGLAPPQLGAYMKYPHLSGYGGMGYGGLGYGAGLGFPPPPLGMGGMAPPPFAPGNPLWAGGGMGGLGMGMGGMYGGLFGEQPAPGVHDNGHNNGPVPPTQPDITVVSGGVPAGVTNVAAEEYTIVIRIKTHIEPWLQPMQPMVCESLNIDSSTSLNRLIQVCRENLECEGWAITECIELGNGLWEKGITFIYGTPTAITGTLKGVGWTNARNRVGGQSLHIYCHKV
ncbi:hypothetical protein K505DRAFT_414863 [Melanomma pulvis-pyrius CBS 109.77]|uniref:Uncharacterized protein n=1 Tax=Melanomma pulvis-pyrius CBS 109.77 TaxID=1314802 RepID=A0A6A6XQA0_9PLEO|nr:hypothetical protein K505DRAFT_414863 [Melanomma pulvis-pyrius CBS 109.77]